MSTTTQGKCVEWPDEGLMNPSEYAKHPNGNWFGMTPNGMLAGLANHGVVEHEDGTISVVPSILTQHAGGKVNDETLDVVSGDQTWHGYLERGVWREC